MGHRLTIAAVCSRGPGGRHGGRPDNEDNYLVCRDSEARFREEDVEQRIPVETEGTILAVADGGSGPGHGALASAAAVRALALLGEQRRIATAETLRVFLLDAHRRMRRKAQTAGLGPMGTSLSVAWIVGNRLLHAHVGTTSLFLVRGDRLVTLSPPRRRGPYAVLIAGDPSHDDGDIELVAGRDSGAETIASQDRLLLCTDGVTSVVEPMQLAEAVVEAPEPAAAASWLVERAIAAGSTDNLTVVLARVDKV